MGNSVMQPLYLKPVTYEKIINILLSLKNSATGWDEIPVKLLKSSLCYIVQALSSISNLSLTFIEKTDMITSWKIFPANLMIKRTVVAKCLSGCYRS